MIFPGIDLGTTYSMIAHVNAYGQPALFPDFHDPSQFRTPSVVYVGRLGCLIGAAAEDLLEDGADIEIARFPKSRLTEPDYRYLDHLERPWNALGLSALVLRKLAHDASAFAGEELGPGVLTVPAQFTDEQRRATRAAAELAGLPGMRLVEEPIAAATFYGEGEAGEDRTLLVFDFGGGTFDVSLLQSAPDGLFVLACDGDPDLGGRRIDEAIMAEVDADFQARFGRSLMSDAATKERLRRACEEAKISLSRPGPAQVRKPLLVLGQAYDFVLTRAQLERIVEPFVSRCMAACERCLADAALTWRDVDKVMLTGGSSALPAVSSALMERSVGGRPQLVTRQPHLAVAYGAAILAGRLERDESSLSFMRPVSTADLAIRVWDADAGAETLEVLIARNTPLPAKQTRSVFTSRSDQAHISFEFVQRRGEPASISTLGRFVFGPVPAPRLHYPVELSVACTREGLVHVAACDSITGHTMQLELREGAAEGFDFDRQRQFLGAVDLALH